ncbi:MAG: rRNA pseudouridine synthase, partial [Desulfuromonadales bacterium]|nr:rRNA pseudouridine synthase [Desulfuromonadales bacterium]
PLRAAQELIYLLLHKPLGVVTTLNDPEGRPLVTDLLSDIPERLFPVGRLDINTSGLLLMTNDGALTNRLAHPRHQVDKIYRVKVRGRLTQQAKQHLEQGVTLDDGAMTAPAQVTDINIQNNQSWFTLTLHEGRNRQVRRMCEALEYQVSRLSRVGYAFLSLDGVVAGKYRHLTKSEVSRLKSLGN